MPKATITRFLLILCATMLGCTTIGNDSEIDGKLDKIIIPEINFSGTVIDDVIAFIEEASVAADPDHVGVSIRLSPELRGRRFPGNSDQIQMGGRRLTLRETLERCCRKLNAEYRIHNGIVVVMPTKRK